MRWMWAPSKRNVSPQGNSTRASQSPLERRTMCSSATVPQTTCTAPTEPSWSWNPVSPACFQPIA